MAVVSCLGSYITSCCVQGQAGILLVLQWLCPGNKTHLLRNQWSGQNWGSIGGVGLVLGSSENIGGVLGE